jgi:hypothetical protein
VSSFPGCCGLLDAKATSSLLRLWWVGSGGTWWPLERLSVLPVIFRMSLLIGSR